MRNSFISCNFVICLLIGNLLSTHLSGSTTPELPVTTNISGTIWIDQDNNLLFNNEPTVSGVTVELLNPDSPFAVASTMTVGGEYSFDNVIAGKYQIRIPSTQLESNGPLEGLSSCTGSNPADDMVDNDDNGINSPFGIVTTVFTLTDENPTPSTTITDIDFCFSQNPCSGPNPLVSTSCAAIQQVDVICDISSLDGLCSTMPSATSGGTQPNPLCDGSSSADNISWLAFVAHEGAYDIVIEPLDCSVGLDGGEGMQVGIYEDCSFEESIFCSSHCSTDVISISSFSLTPGQIYYLYIDGCEGSTCSYGTSIVGTFSSPTLDVSDVCIVNNGVLVCDSTEYCRAAPVQFVATDLDINADFSWSIEVLSGGPYAGAANVISTSNTLSLTFANEGRYEVCMTGVDNGCFSNSNTFCTKVEITDEVPVVSDEIFADQILCFEDSSSFDIGALSGSDPNGDGVFGWQGSADIFVLGNNQAIIPTPGCSYTQEFDLSILPENEVEDVFVTVCGQDLPVTVEGIMITEALFGGSNLLTVDELESTIPDVNGCSRIVNLTVENLNLGGTSMADPICTFEGAILDFDYDPTQSANIIFLSFMWIDPFGNFIIDDYNPSDPTDIALSEGSVAGTYILRVTINKNGIQCVNNYPVTVDFSTFGVSNPTISGVDQVCSNSGTSVTYTATATDAALPFLWEYPNDVASASLSGVLDNMLTIDWTGSAGGNVAVQNENNCGISDQVAVTVTILAAPQAAFTLDTELCVGTTTTVMSTTNAGISLHDWDFGDATIVSGGSGAGPHTLSWAIAGTKEVSLQITGFNTCVSEELTRSITIAAPVAAPVVSCTPSVNDVIFTWPGDAGVSYDVEILSGQTGDFLNATSFQVDGLSAGDEVEITVTATENNSPCSDPLTTTAACVAQDCPPTIISLSAPQTSFCSDETNEITINAAVTTDNTGSGTFAGPGIIDAGGRFDPMAANIGINTITYTYIADNGCSASETISMTLLELPVADFDLSDDLICITESVDLTYSGSGGIDNFLWEAGGATVAIAPNPTLTFATSGAQTISLTVDRDGCTSETVSQTLEVASELSAVQISCSPSAGSVTFSWNEVQGSSSFLISINGTTEFSSGNTSTTVSGLQSEEEVTLSVTAISDGPCPDVAAEITCASTLVGLEDISIEQYSLYPNPAYDMLTIQGSIPAHKLMIIDVNGAVVKTSVYTNSLDISALATGVYFMRIMQENGKERVLRFLKI